MREKNSDLKKCEIKLKIYKEELEFIKEQFTKIKDEYINIFDNSPIGYVIIDYDTFILKINNYGSELLGKSKSELLLKKFLLFVDGNDRPILQKHIDSVFKENKIYSDIIKIHNGVDLISIKIKSNKIKENDKIFLIMENVHELCEIKQKKLELEHNYQFLFDYMTDAFALHEMIFDLNNNPIDYIFLDVNPAFEKITGLKNEDIKFKRITTLIPKIEFFWIELYGEVVKTNQPKRFQSYTEVLNKIFDVYAHPIDNNQFMTIIRDITEQVQLEKSLIKAKKELENVIETKQETIYNLTLELKKTLDIIFNVIMVLKQDLKEEYQKEISEIILLINNLLLLLKHVNEKNYEEYNDIS